MLGLLLLVAAAQDTLPTVGDTLWATRRLSVPAGVAVRPRPARPTGRIEPLGPPDLRTVDGTIEVRYALVAWEPGRHEVTLPGVILVRDDGWSDTLPDWSATLDVASVLPAGGVRDSLPVQPPAALVAQAGRSLLPLGVLVLFALLALGPLHWAWRRKGVRPVHPVTAGRPPTAARLESWVERGELRAAVEGWRARLEAAAVPGTNSARDDILKALQAARYAPTSAEDLRALCRRAAAAEGETGG